MIKSSKVISKLMEKNSKIVNDDVQQPEDEINRAPQLNDDEEVSSDDEIEAIFRLSSHKKPSHEV